MDDHSYFKLKNVFVSCITIVTILSIVIACSNTSKSKLEQDVELGIKQNLGNPSDFIEIVSINLVDSTDYNQLYNKIIPVDTLVDKIIGTHDGGVNLINDIAAKVDKIPSSEREKIKGKVLGIMMGLLSIDNYVSNVREAEKVLHDAYASTDSTYLFSKSYKVKARIKENGTPVVKSFNASSCIGIDSVIVSAEEIKMEDMPIATSKLLSAFSNYIEKVKPLYELLSNNTDLMEELSVYQ
jgi:hypothetical protein